MLQRICAARLRQSSGVLRQLLEQRAVHLVADTDAEYARIARPFLYRPQCFIRSFGRRPAKMPRSTQSLMTARRLGVTERTIFE